MITIYTLAIFAAIIVQAFFTASEMAFTCINRIKLKDLQGKGDPAAKKLNDFLEKKGMYLGTTLVGTNMAVVVSAALATRIFTEYFNPRFSPILVTIVLVPVTLVFAEIIPKMLARQFSIELALKSITPLSGFFRLFYPLIVTVNSIAGFILLPFGRQSSTWDLTLTKRDLKEILHLGGETGEVEEDEIELIHKVLDFGSKTVGRIMVPLYRVSSIDINDSTNNLKKLVSLTGFSRIPVYKGDKSDIMGIVNIYDILFKLNQEDSKDILSDFMRDPVYVRKNDGLDIALTRLRHREQPMGIVVDEKESVVGIVTIEDMLEEIVGEIEDRG